MDCFTLGPEEEQVSAIRERLILACADKAESHRFENEDLITESKVMAQIGG